MAPQTKIGLVGLGASVSGTGWAAAAHLPYLRSPAGRERFKIVALLNSSEQRAREAIKAHGLDESEVKAYGNPEDLANDPNVEMIVVSTRVDTHAGVSIPSLRKGKDAFVEWPLERSGEVAGKMVAALREGGGRGIVGLQARQSPFATKLREIIASGRIGKVLSVSFSGAATKGGPDETENLSYFNDRATGGGIFGIHTGHTLDVIFDAVSQPATVSSILSTQHPEVSIVDPSTNPPTRLRTEPRNSPDHVLVLSQLKNGAVFNFNLRGGAPIPPQSGWPGLTLPFELRIYGGKGEVVVSSTISFMVQIKNNDFKMYLHDHASNSVEEIPLDEGPFADLPESARNTARVYDGYAASKGWQKQATAFPERIVDFDEALRLHHLLDGMLERWDKGQQGWAVPS